MENFDDEEEEVSSQEGSGNSRLLNEGKKQAEKQVKKGIEKQAKKEVTKKVAEESAKVAAKIAAKGSLLAAIGPILVIILIVIFILVVIIGIALFLKTMPGMVVEKLKDLGKELINGWTSWWGADSNTQIKDEKLYEILDYLDEMGYDLKGYGFLTEYFGDEDDAEEDGVIKEKDADGEEKITKAESMFVYTYMVSDNYIYTLKQDNITTTGFLKPFSALFAHALGFLRDKWSKGLIEIYYDEGKIGTEKYANINRFLNMDDLEIDPEKNKLIVNRGAAKNTLEYNLDGWTGRYGMPLEFLLSLHFATMMPDLAFDMVNNFVLDKEESTIIHLCLHPIGGNDGDNSGEILAAYYTGSTYVTYKDFYEAISEGFWPTDGWTISGEEALSIIQKYGIVDKCQQDPKCNVNTEITEACSDCESYIEQIYSELKGARVKDFKCYQPYISKVTNHWYRDVYFVTTDDINPNLVTYDYDYEALMKERWTLYETYGTDTPDKMGEFKLYALKEDGNYATEINEVDFRDSNKTDKAKNKLKKKDGKVLFDGSKSEANELAISVAKSAKTEKISEGMGKDLGWNDLEDGVWSAYKLEEGATTTDWEQLYPKEAAGTIKSKIYTSMYTTGNIVQTGEGQRAETNPRIKKLFLNNRYFRYTGNPNEAEAITALRKENDDIDYGALKLPESELKKKKVNLKINDKETEYNAYDLSGQVQINQESLDAFSMLENTHTLDADYIYRDFKELIVELGYFEKEELTDETPRLLEFPVPDIGSAGYPNRAIDKKENEYGTMLHSKGDIDANEGNVMANRLKEILDFVNDPANNGEPGGNLNSQINVNLSLGNKGYDLKPDGQIDMNKISQEIGALTTEKDPSEVSVEEFLEAAAKVHSEMEGDYWEYCAGGAHSGECSRHTASGSCGNYETLEDAKAGACLCDCSTYVSWVLQEVGLVKGRDYTGTEGSNDGLYKWAADLGIIYTKEEAGELQPGDITLKLNVGDKSGHTQIYGEDGYWYNAGSTDSIRKPPYQDDYNDFKYIIRFNFSNKKSEGKPYEGYKGNEAVVSPVTGILLEYGTYDKEKDIDNLTEEPYRVNTDLKYGNSIVLSSGAGKEEPDPNNNEKPQSDQVGYAKILVLDAENYKKLEASTGNRWKNNGTSLVNVAVSSTGGEDETIKSYYSDYEGNDLILKEEKQLGDNNLDGDKSDKWPEIDKLVYGYKEFAEEYEYAGISGYTVYIDGFVCERPDEEFSNEENIKENLKNKIPNDGKHDNDDVKLQMSTYQNITESIVSNEDNADKLLPSLYVPSEKNKVASEKATKKLNAEVAVKTQAPSSICISDGGEKLVFIKEGTLLGRTMTDRELIMEVREHDESELKEFRPSIYDENAYNKNEEIKDKVMGNYLRVIMRDTDDTPVENVEDYMKLDDGDIKTTLGSIEQFMYWQAKEPEGFEYIIDGQQSYSLYISNGKSRSDNPADKYGHNYFVDDGGVGDSNLCPGIYVGGGSGKEIFSKVTGDTNIVQLQSYCTGEQLLDIYTQELEAQIEAIKTQYPTTADWDEEDTRLFALIDVMYAGEGNFKIGTIDDVLLAGGTLTKEDFLSNCTTENAFYNQNPEGFTRRRLCDWYMYSEGKFGHNLYDTQDTSDITERWEFKSETPFQDLMVDKEGAELVDM